MKKLLVLDIDQTLVDSSIRENECWHCDILDLDKYLSLKSDGIVNDSLLPLGHWVEKNAKSLNFCLVTSRELTKEDWQSFFKLIPNTVKQACEIVSRNNAERFNSSALIQCSALYKQPILKYLQNQFTSQLVVIDDCPKVLQIARQGGHHALCARDLWHLSEADIMGIIENALY
jgi:hypothetical protein